MIARSLSRTKPAISWQFWMLLVLLSLVGGHTPAMASEPSGAHEQYRVLQWEDLVPDGWEPPLVAKAYDEVSDAHVDETSVVKNLDGQLSAQPGYMKPIAINH